MGLILKDYVFCIISTSLLQSDESQRLAEPQHLADMKKAPEGAFFITSDEQYKLRVISLR
jgi:hypothetical protein